MRPALALVLAVLAGGCTSASEATWLVTIDGRFAMSTDDARAFAEAALAEGGARRGVRDAGALGLGEARLLTLDGRALAAAPYAGLDARAAETLGARRPAPGGVVLDRALADEAGLREGDRVVLASDAWPAPVVTTGFEMERLVPCSAGESRFCALDSAPDETRIRMKLPPGAHDLAFLADVVELGAHNVPAWWNGTLTSPGGRVLPIASRAVTLAGPFEDSAFAGEAEAGTWEIRFTLDVNGSRATRGTAGRVSVREPGYAWFDDRILALADARAQGAAVLAGARATRVDLVVEAVADAPAGALPAPASVILAIEDARTLRGDGAGEAGGLLLAARGGDAGAVAAAARAAGATTALPALAATVVRPLPERAPAHASPGGALVLAAPVDLDPADLPAVAGAGAPVRAIAARVPLAGAPAGLLALAPVDGLGGRLAPGGRWADEDAALASLAASPVVAIASPDAASAPNVRIDGREDARTRVVAGTLIDGPDGAVWVSAASLQNLGAPAGLVLVVRADDPDAVLRAWATFGVARVTR